MKLEAIDISFKYGKGSRQILDHVNLSVEPGESSFGGAVKRENAKNLGFSQAKRRLRSQNVNSAVFRGLSRVGMV